MKRSRAASGYTIVETMLFLAITGVLLASAVLVFNGRQRRTQFTQGVRELETRIQAVINEAATGYYPNKGDLSCTSSNGGGPQLNTVDNEQGTNVGCIFLGRSLQFTTGKTYSAYTIVGQQKGLDGKDVTSLGRGLNDARQTLIVQSEVAPDAQPNAPTNAIESFTMPWGITVEKIIVPGGAETGALSFISTLGSYNASGTNLVSGSAQLSLIPLASTTLSSQAPALISATRDMTDAMRNPGKVILCLRSGGGDRQAAIIIGENNNIGTEVLIDSVPGECQDDEA